MNAICRVLLTSALLAIFVSHSTGKLTVKPRDTDALVRHSTYFNCSTDIGTTAIFWFHGTKYVYTGTAILEPYHERFKVDKSKWNGTYIYNLVIHSVQPEDAGEYRCEEDEGAGEKYSVQLAVLDDDPVCRSNIELDEVIGQNSCNIEPDEVELECSVRYHGKISPILEWERIGENSTAPLKVSAVAFLNQYTSTLKLKGDIALNNSSYICGTKRTTQEPKNCTSKVMKILYALSDNFTVHKTTDDAIVCSANTTQFCSYKWRWVQDNDVTTESPTAVLIAKKPGLHRCEAECYIRNETCKLLVMRAMVYGEQKIASVVAGEIVIAVVVPITIIVIMAALVVVLVVLYKRKAQLSSEEEMPLVETTSDSNEKWDLTVLDQELFIIFYERKGIEVYDSTEFQFKRRMEVNGITNPRSIASCSVKNCLYAIDLEYQQQPHKILSVCGIGESDQKLHQAILRIEPINGKLITKWEITGGQSKLSVASDTNVIICPFNGYDLYEYTADGELLRVIDLGRNPVDITRRINAKHAVKLDNGCFVVCQFDPGEVYLMSTRATSSTFGRIYEVEILKKFGEELGDLNSSVRGPMHLSVDKEGSILVTDISYCRVVLMNSNLGEARILISKKDGMKSPWRTCFNESTGEWLVTDYRRIFVGRVEGVTIKRQIRDLIVTKRGLL